MQNTLAELQTSTLYDTDASAEANGVNGYLRTLAEHGSYHHDVCHDMQEDGYDDEYDPLGAMFRATMFVDVSRTC